MTTSYHVRAIRKPDDQWHQMKKIYDSCQEAGVHIPPEVDEFFGFEKPNPLGVEIDLDDVDANNEQVGETTWTVALADIPKQCTHIQFCTSY